MLFLTACMVINFSIHAPGKTALQDSDQSNKTWIIYFKTYRNLSLVVHLLRFNRIYYCIISKTILERLSVNLQFIISDITSDNIYTLKWAYPAICRALPVFAWCSKKLFRKYKYIWKCPVRHRKAWVIDMWLVSYETKITKRRVKRMIISSLKRKY